MTRLWSFLKDKSQYLCRKLLYLVTRSCSWFVKHYWDVFGDALTIMKQMYLCMSCNSYLPHVFTFTLMDVFVASRRTELKWSIRLFQGFLLDLGMEKVESPNILRLHAATGCTGLDGRDQSIAGPVPKYPQSGILPVCDDTGYFVMMSLETQLG